MKNKFANAKLIKKITAVLVVVMLLFTFVSCAGTTPEADNASGTSGALNWSYVKDSKTLTISPTAAAAEMIDFENSDTVAWTAVCMSVERVVIGEGVTKIGNYAFYYMPHLKEVVIPSTVTSIGASAFAYCSALTSIGLPEGLLTIGNSAFEGCGALASIYIPTSISSVGDRAFAYCYSMTGVMMTSQNVTVGKEAFKNCKALGSLVLSTEITADKIASDAFAGAAMDINSATRSENPDATTTITVKYMLDGAEVDVKTETHKYGVEYSIATPARDGYTADISAVKGVADGSDKEVVVTYSVKESEETTTPPVDTAEPDDEDEAGAPAIVAVVIMGVVLVGIAVGAVLMIRSDKKQMEKGTTVRKVQNNNKDTHKQQGKKRK